jgi:hypothetical protein
VLFGRIGGLEAERFGDFCPRGRQTLFCQGVLDEHEYLALARREIFDHGVLPVWMYSMCCYIQVQDE